MHKKGFRGRLSFSISSFVTTFSVIIIIFSLFSSFIAVNYVPVQARNIDPIQQNLVANITSTTSNFLTYENPTFGIKLQYPVDWEKVEPSPNEILLSSPTENTSNRLSNYLLIVANTLDIQNITLDEFTSIQIEFLRESFPDLDLIESNATTLAGNPAHKVIFEHREGARVGGGGEEGEEGGGEEEGQDDSNFKLIQIWTIKGDNVYYITYRQDLGKYSNDYYLQTIEKMIDTFEINDFLTYENPTFGIKLQYPVDWEKIEEADQYYLEGSNQHSIVSFLLPIENASDRFMENLTISVENLPRNTTFNAYSDETIKKYNATTFDLIESNATTLAGNPAHKVIFEHREGARVGGGGEEGEEEEGQDDSNFKLIQIWTIKGDKVYQIAFQVDLKRYSEILSIVQKMIDTFEINDFLTYENPTFGIKLQYPVDWEKIEGDGNITFISPSQSTLDIYRQKLIITTDQFLKNITLNEYIDAFINISKKNASDIKIIEQNPITFADNNTAYRIVMNTKQGEHSLTIMAVLAIKDDKVYLIEYISETEEYSKHLATIQKMIDSVQIGRNSFTAQFFGFAAPLLGIPLPILPPLGAGTVPVFPPPSTTNPEDNQTVLL